jgi:hypothetical protein
MSVLPRPVDYTDRDFDSLRHRLIELVKGAFPDWTDFDEANFGTILLEMQPFVGDVLMYYLNRGGREAFLATALLRESVRVHAEQRGYKLRGASAARADVVLTLEKVPAGRVVIPAGTGVRTEEVTEPVRHQLLSDVLILAGADPPAALATTEHSETFTERFEASGLGDFEVLLRQTPYLDGSAVIATAEGAFSEVSSFYGSKPSDRHFAVKVDQRDRARIVFGSGTNGKPPSGTITATYKTGGGQDGRVDAGRLVVIEGGLQDEFGNSVRVTVTNPNATYGGNERESVAEGKRNAQRKQRAAKASINREDFEIHAEAVDGVARALMLTADEDPSLDENSGDLYVVPDGGGAPAQSLKDEVLRYIKEEHPPFTTFKLRVQDPVYLSVDLEAHVFFQRALTLDDRRAVASDAALAVRVFFARAADPERDRAGSDVSADDGPQDRIGFGFHVGDGGPGEIAWSSVLDVIRDMHGVLKLRPDGLLLNGSASDVVLGIRDFPVIGTVRIVDGETGDEVFSG